MEYFDLKELPKFKNPEEELNFLREHIARREAQLNNEGVNLTNEQVAHQTIESYKNVETANVLHEGFVTDEGKAEGIALRLHHEAHDANVEEFMTVLLEQGIKNALNINLYNYYFVIRNQTGVPLLNTGLFPSGKYAVNLARIVSYNNQPVIMEFAIWK